MSLREPLPLRAEDSKIETDHLRFELARLRSRNAAAERQMMASERRLDGVRCENTRLVAQLSALRRSRSWQITKPLRLILRSLRSGRT